MRVTGPLGRERADHQAAVVAKTIADVNRGKSTGKRYKLADFIPRWGGGDRRGAELDDALDQG